MDGQGTTRRRNIAENFNRLSRVHQRYRQTDDRQTDERPMTYSELEFTFANKIPSVERPSDLELLHSYCYELVANIIFLLLLRR